MAGRAVGGKKLYRNTNCIAIERLGSWVARRARRWALGWALGWACNRRWGARTQRGRERGVLTGAQGVRQAGTQAGAGRRMQARARAGSGTIEREGHAGSWTAGARAARRGLGAGRAGWPGLCTPLGFQPGFSTWYFS